MIVKMDENVLHKLFMELSTEAQELYLDSTIQELQSTPSALTFLRDYVSLNKPVVVRGGVNHWHAISRWNFQYLRQKIGDQMVTVAVTPNGYADAVTLRPDGSEMFILPEERQMSVNQFLDVLTDSASIPDRRHVGDDVTYKSRDVTSRDGDSRSGDTHDGDAVFYVQKQNSNFSDEFSDLLQDVEPLRWAEEAFNKSPDAVNFWMGDKRAITSVHKDHYENIYCVVSGSKTFTLIPPTDQPFIPYEEFSVGRYHQNDSTKTFEVLNEDSLGKVPWIGVDVLNPDMNRYPLYSHAHPVTVTLSAGDLLYLPSLWYHHVQQSHACISVNYWYDMNYDIKYCYYKFIESLSTKLRKQRDNT